MVVPPSWNQKGDADLGENPAREFGLQLRQSISPECVFTASSDNSLKITLDEVSHRSFSSQIGSQSNVDPMAPEGSPKRS